MTSRTVGRKSVRDRVVISAVARPARVAALSIQPFPQSSTRVLPLLSELVEVQVRFEETRKGPVRAGPLTILAPAALA